MKVLNPKKVKELMADESVILDENGNEMLFERLDCPVNIQQIPRVGGH